MTHPAVVECSITGVPDVYTRSGGEKPPSCWSKEYENRAATSWSRRFRIMQSASRPHTNIPVVEFRDELPKTISGKIRRVEIRPRRQQQND